MSDVVYDVEVTDTFGGEANYAWVRRAQVTVDDNASDLALVRRAKNAMGWNGLRCSREEYGDIIVLRPYGICAVMFITYHEPEAV